VVAAGKGMVLKQDAFEEEPNVVLQNLIRAEVTLMEEKKKLVALKEKLNSKVQKEIKSKTSNIQRLRAEISDLKFDCDKLSKSLDAGDNSK
jgi:septal ring factor EnvC (AmiA/AmiB activator)